MDTTKTKNVNAHALPTLVFVLRVFGCAGQQSSDEKRHVEFFTKFLKKSFARIMLEEKM